MESALELYNQALAREESPVVLYNISQAYGRAFQVDELTQALEQAQALDGDLVAEFTRLQGAQPEGFVVDLPLPAEMVSDRIHAGDRGTAFAADFRAPVAPGRLGSGVLLAVGGFAAVAAVALLLGTRLRPSSWCPRCGRRVCPRCDPDCGSGRLCDACHRLFFQPEQTDRDMRLARIEALRERETRVSRLVWLASLLVPGAAGLLAERPLRSLLGALLFALAVFALVWRNGMVPDPLVAGGAGPFAFLLIGAVAAFGYAVVVAMSLATRRRA